MKIVGIALITLTCFFLYSMALSLITLPNVITLMGTSVVVLAAVAVAILYRE